LAAEPLSRTAVVKSDRASKAEPWRWWWLVILGGSLSGWAAVIVVTLLLKKLF
jgi:hypothetical protein